MCGIISEANFSSQYGKFKFTSLNTKMGLEKVRFFTKFDFTQSSFPTFLNPIFRLHQNKDTTSRGVLNPRPGLHVKRASFFLRPPLRLAKTAACFWKALSVYPVTIGEKNERKRGEKSKTINHATKQNGEQVIIMGMQYKNIVD